MKYIIKLGSAFLISVMLFSSTPVQAQTGSDFLTILNRLKQLLNSSEQVGQVSGSLTTGLVAHYAFDEGSGTTAKSETGSPSLVVNGATWTTGKKGGALQFNGVDGYAQADSLTGITAYPFTISTWVQSDGGGAVAGLYNPNSSNIIKAIVVSKSTNELGLRITNTRGEEGTVLAEVGKWHHVVAVFASPGKRELYVDGVLNQTFTFTPDYVPSVSRIGIGRYSDASPDNYFKGVVDDVRIYNRALSSTEVSELFTSAGGTVTTPTTPVTPTEPEPVNEPVQSSQSTWYIDSAATNGLKDGTSWTNAWTTGIDWLKVKPGHTIVVRGGEYSGNFNFVEKSDVTVKIAPDATAQAVFVGSKEIMASKNILIDGLLNGKPMIKFTGLKGVDANTEGQGFVMRIRTSNTVTLRGVEVTREEYYKQDARPIHGININNSTGAGSDMVIIEDSHIHHLTSDGVNINDKGPVVDFDRFIVRRTKINNINDDAIQAASGITLHDSYLDNGMEPPRFGGHRDGIQTGIGQKYFRVYNNYFKNFGQNIFIEKSAGYVELYNNIMESTRTSGTDRGISIGSNGVIGGHFVVANNVFYNFRSYTGLVGSLTPIPLTHKFVGNNIFLNVKYPGPNSILDSTNIYWDEPGVQYYSTEGAPVTTLYNRTVGASVKTDPKFIDPANGNFRLRQDSPAINAGKSFSNFFSYDIQKIARPQGFAWDIGAYEYYNGQPTTPTVPTPPTPTEPNTPTPDTTSPIVGAVSVTTITATGATVTFSTDEYSTSKVHYGTTKTYSDVTPVNTTTAVHTHTLSNLSPNTIYHYQITATDQAGNITVSSDATFTTASAPEAPVTNEPTTPRTQTRRSGGGSNVIRTPATVTTPTALQAPVTTPTYTFTRSLRIGSTGEDVRQLQIFLNNNGFTVSTTGTGAKGFEGVYYGAKTAAAVTRFQEAYRAEILTPGGLTRGTGTVGPATLRKLNIMQGSIMTTVTTPTDTLSLLLKILLGR